MKPIILVGAGGHAKALVETALVSGQSVCAYVDPKECPWLTARHVTEDHDVKPTDGNVVVGFGAVEPEGLRRRLRVLDGYLERGFDAPPLIHRAAYVSPDAELEPGVAVLGGAVVQPGAVVGRGSIVNSGAIIEHDASIGSGTHVAPGAIVLGDCRVGDCCMIGAGAVVLQMCLVPSDTLVPALERIGQRYAR